jgi:phosphatidylglycerophosphate synthase
MDLLDGPVARATKSTRFSTVFDPFTDKIALAAILASVLWYDVMPWPVALFIALQNITMVVLAYKTYDRANKLGATVLGKLNMFAQTTTILLFIASSLAPKGPHALLAVAAYADFAASIALGLLSIGLYTRMLRKTLQQP